MQILFSVKGQFGLRQLRKFRESFRSKCFVGQIQCSFDNPVKTFPELFPEFFAQSPKKFMNLGSISEQIYENVPLDTWNSILGTLPKLFRFKFQIGRSKNHKVNKFNFFIIKVVPELSYCFHFFSKLHSPIFVTV